MRMRPSASDRVFARARQRPGLIGRVLRITWIYYSIIISVLCNATFPRRLAVGPLVSHALHSQISKSYLGNYTAYILDISSQILIQN